MEIITATKCKSRIAKIIEEAKDELYVVTYSFNISNADLIRIYESTSSGVNVTILTGRPLEQNVRERLEMLPRLKVFFNKLVHAKIYMNESEAISTSCNFSELNIPKLFECGVYLNVANDKKDYNLLKKEIDQFLIEEHTDPVLKTSSRQLQAIDLRKLVGIGQ